MALRPYRTALVGCGLIARDHAAAYARFPGRAEVAWCVDVDPARAAALAGELGARATSDLEEALGDPELDAVEVLTPHHAHAGPTLAALRARRPVLLQKPLAPTLDEARALAAAAEETGVPVVYGELAHHSSSVRAAADAVAAGRIGRVVALQANYAHWQGGEILGTAWRYDPAVAGGGALLDGGIHYLALLRRLGGPCRATAAATRNFRPELGGEDTSAVLLEFASGAVGTLVSTHASRRWPDGPTCTVFGDEGLIALRGPWGAATLHRPGAEPEVLHPGPESLFGEMLEALLDVLDGRPNRVPPAEGVADQLLVAEAYAAAGRRSPDHA